MYGTYSVSFSVYKGVEDGSVEYIRKNKTDFWVLQRNATNILRGSSFLTTFHGQKLQSINGINRVSPVLLILSSVIMEDRTATIFLTGYNTDETIGGPPDIIMGRRVEKDNEIVLDRSFARKFKFDISDELIIQNDTLQVVGFSIGTNAFVIQYGFVTLQKAQSLAGIATLITVFLVETDSTIKATNLINEIQKVLPDVEVIPHEQFLNNNIAEMESGFLPLLYSIAFIGAIVLTTILSLLLTINILERKKDYAVMKIIGASGIFLKSLVIKQGLVISITGCFVGLTLFFPLVYLIEVISPEVSTKTTIEQVIFIVFILVFISLISSIISILRLKKIYSLEVFNER